MRILLLVILLFILGCTHKPTNDFVKIKQNSIINTQRDQFTKDGVKYLVLTSYISEIDSNITSKEYDEFIVAVYKNNFSETSNSLSNVLLNKKMDNITVTHLEKGDKRIELFPIKNQWVHYFFIQAPAVYDTNLTLSYEIDHSFVVQSDFLKDF